MLARGTVGLFQGVVDTVIERFAHRVLVRLLNRVVQTLPYSFLARLRELLGDNAASFQLDAEATRHHGGGKTAERVGRVVGRFGGPLPQPCFTVDGSGGVCFSCEGVVCVIGCPIKRRICAISYGTVSHTCLNGGGQRLGSSSRGQ